MSLSLVPSSSSPRGHGNRRIQDDVDQHWYVEEIAIISCLARQMP